MRVTRKVKCSRTSMPGKSWSRCAAMTSSSGTNRVSYMSASGDSSEARLDAQQAGQHRRHLDPGEVLLVGARVDQHDGQVERQPGDVGERVGRVDGQRGEHREEPAR